MQIGDDEVLSLKQAAERLGVRPETLAQQAKRGKLRATLVGHTYMVMGSDLAAYDELRKQARGFARPDHPLHGKRGGGGRRKKGPEREGHE